MAYFPVFIDLEGKKCLVVGGGRVAARKAAQLLDYGANLLVVAKEISPAMRELAAAEQVGSEQSVGAGGQPGPGQARCAGASLEQSGGAGRHAGPRQSGGAGEHTGPEGCAGSAGPAGTGRIRFQLRPARVEDADGMDLVICASDDRKLHQEVAAFCRERKILVDVADDGADSSFLFPGLVRQGDVVLGITTGGKSPAAVRYLRTQLEKMLPPFLGRLVDRLGALRGQIKGQVEDPKGRAELFTELFALGMDREGWLPDELVQEKLAQKKPVQEKPVQEKPEAGNRKCCGRRRKMR